jgi:hypothetical protein
MPFGSVMGQPPNKKKPGELIQNIKPLLKELMGPRWPRLVIGLVLVMIGRAAGLVAPASTRFLVDTGATTVSLPATFARAAGIDSQRQP